MIHKLRGLFFYCLELRRYLRRKSGSVRSAKHSLTGSCNQYPSVRNAEGYDSRSRDNTTLLIGDLSAIVLSTMSNLPSTMNAVLYSAPRKFEIKEIPLPQVGDDEVLFKGTPIIFYWTRPKSQLSFNARKSLLVVGLLVNVSYASASPLQASAVPIHMCTKANSLRNFQ